MTAVEVLRALIPLLLSLAAVSACEALTARRGLLPPGFAIPWRRALANVLLAFTFFFAVFAPLASIGVEGEVDLSELPPGQLFALHILFCVAILGWYVLGFTGLARTSIAVQGEGGLIDQIGLRTPRLGEDAAWGLAVGLGAWIVVLGSMLAVGSLVYWLAGPEAVPHELPPVVPFIAGLPVALRLALAISAGVVEESFFRGFLQPRVGIALSTVFFVFAHLSYEQPIMLFGIGLLSLIYAYLVRWRQTIWPAIVAHTLFDAIQLLVTVPAVLEFWGGFPPAPHP